MRKLITLITALVIIFSCKKRNDEKRGESSNLQKPTTLYFKNDVVLKTSYLDNHLVVLNWGVKNQFMNQSKDTLSWVSDLKESVKRIGNYLIFSNSCGSGCNYSYLMKLEENDVARLIMYPVFINEQANVIVYKGEDEDVLLIIENLETGKKSILRDKYDLTKRPPVLAIDSVFIKGQNLIVRWYDESSKIRVKEIYLE